MPVSPWHLVYALQAGMVGAGLLAVYFVLTTPTLLCVATLLLLLYPLYCRQRRRAAGVLSLHDKIVLITGCDTGFGHHLAKTLVQQGCHVIATVYKPGGPGAQSLRDVTSERMTVLPLDVSSDESVAQCLGWVRQRCETSGLWGLVNNAGHNFVGEVELTTMAQYLMVTNINVMGMVRTTRAFLPLLRQAKGRIVNVTSIKGQLSTPLNAAYNISKFAGETFSEITRMEMRQFGVKVIVVEPGNFGGATGCINDEGLARIKGELQEMWSQASQEVKALFPDQHIHNILHNAKQEAAITYPSLTPVTQAITTALCSSEPEFRYIVGGSSRLFDLGCMLVRLKPFFSDRCFQQLVCYCLPYSIDTDDISKTSSSHPAAS